MRFSLQALFIGLFIFFMLMGAIFVFVAVQVFQHSLLNIAPGELRSEEISEATISVAIQQGFIVFAVLAIIGGLLFFVLRAFIMVPLHILHASIQEVGEKNFPGPLPKGPDNEIGDLFEAFNKMTERLKDAKERDEAVSRMKSEFLSIAAHQLRTPLSAFKWLLRLVLDGDLGKLKKSQEELLQKGYDSNERMIELVNDLLDVVRIEEGRFNYTFTRTSLVRLLEKTIRDMKILADQKGIVLTFHTQPPAAIPMVALDTEKFPLAFTNILDNAIQYTLPKGKVDVDITFQKDILVTVRDTGVGIPKRQLPRVFTKFFRGDNAVRIQTSGSGLGLFIAKNIIEKHGGKIWIESIEGKGTTVYFTIPASHK